MTATAAKGQLDLPGIPAGMPGPPINQEKAELVNKAWAKLSPAERWQAFLEYDKRHPEIREGIIWLSRTMKNLGVKQWGIQAAFEVLRFEWVIRYNSSDFKVNNNYRSYYSRLIMSQEHDLEGFYEIRQSR